jgi:hypothetical protein
MNLLRAALLACGFFLAALLPSLADEIGTPYPDASNPPSGGNPGSVTRSVVIKCLNSAGQAVPVSSGQCAAGAQVSGSQFSTFTATIANAASLSGAVDLGLNRLFAIVIPSTWTGTTTPITFQASVDGVTYGELYDSTGTEVQVTVTGVSTYILNASPAEWLGVRYIKVRSGTLGSPVNQGQSTNITVVGVP